MTDSKNVYIDGITVVNPDHYSIFGGGSKVLPCEILKPSVVRAGRMELT